MGETFAGTAFLDHRLRDEVGHRFVVHSIDQRSDDVDGADHRLRLCALIEELQHRVGREAPRDLSHLTEHRVETRGVVGRQPLGEPPHERQEHRRVRVGVMLRAGLFELRHQIVEPGRVLDDIQQQTNARIVQLEPGSRQGGGQDLVHRRLDPLLLAQHFGVVDFLNFDARTAGRRPEMLDAPIAPDIFRRARQQQEQRAPRFGVSSRVEGKSANQMLVQEVGELGDARVGLRQGCPLEQELVGEHLKPIRPLLGQGGRQLRQAAERRRDRRMASRIQGDRPRGRLARPREFRESRGRFGVQCRCRGLFGHPLLRGEPADRSRARQDRPLRRPRSGIPRGCRFPRCSRASRLGPHSPGYRGGA